MNLLLQLLIVTALIALMVLLRIFSGRRVIQQRLSCDPGSDRCGESECSHACGEYNIEVEEE